MLFSYLHLYFNILRFFSLWLVIKGTSHTITDREISILLLLQKMDSHNIESSNANGFDTRPLKKAKCEQLNDCDLSPSLPSSTSLASSCDNIESSNVYDLDAQPLKEEKGDQMNDLDISLSPPSGTTLPSSSPVSIFLVHLI